MSFKFRHFEKIVGFFTLTGLVILLVTIIFLGREQRWFETKVTLTTVFDNGENLSKGMNVKLNGLDIGHANGVSFTSNNQVKVTFTIYREFITKIRTDSYVFRESSSPLGGGHLKLTLGSEKGTPITNNSVLLSQDSDHVQSLLANGIIPQRSSSLNQIVKNINQLTGQLAAPQGALFGTLFNLKKMTAELASGTGTLHSLATDNRLYANLLQAVSSLEQVALDLRAFSTTLRGVAPNVRNIVVGAEKGMSETTKLLSSLQRYFLVTTDKGKPADQKNTSPLTVIKVDRRDRD